eukprot:7260414-Pyramimonas_sp.AAC.1
MNNPEKRKFVEEVIAGNFESEYFRRFEKVAKVDTNSETGTWMSWKQITDLDGEALVNVQIQQKTVITRPHSKLDAEAESTKSLPEHERLEYKKVSEVESTLTSIETGATRSTDAVPPEEDDDDPERDEHNKKSMSVIRKTHNAHQNASIGIKMRLGKYKDNRYLWTQCDESTSDGRVPSGATQRNCGTIGGGGNYGTIGRHNSKQRIYFQRVSEMFRDFQRCSKIFKDCQHDL